METTRGVAVFFKSREDVNVSVLQREISAYQEGAADARRRLNAYVQEFYGIDNVSGLCEAWWGPFTRPTMFLARQIIMGSLEQLAFAIVGQRLSMQYDMDWKIAPFESDCFGNHRYKESLIKVPTLVFDEGGLKEVRKTEIVSKERRRVMMSGGPRQLNGEKKALQYIRSILDAQKIEYQLQEFQTAIPVTEHAELLCDGKKIPAEGCSFVSGDIDGKDVIVSSAIDNASGVAVVLAALIDNPAMLQHCLFVFAGNEELSYDKPTYWGHGFRVLEKKHPILFTKAYRIIAIDCVGNGAPQVIADPGIVSRAFPLVNAASYEQKTVLVTGDFVQLMTVYHSDRDDGRGISESYLRKTVHALIALL